MTYSLKAILLTAVLLMPQLLWAKDHRQAKAVLDLEAAIRFEGADTFLSLVVEQVQNIATRWRVRKKAPPSLQASNLYQNGAYLSAEDVGTFVAAGGDLSMLNPGPESTFWERPASIAQVDVRAAAAGETLRFYAGITPKFPEQDVYWFDEVKTSDTKPKVDVSTRTLRGKRYASN